MTPRTVRLTFLAAIVVVLVLGSLALAGPPRLAPDARGYERYLARQAVAAVQPAPAATPRRTYTADLPPEVPLDRTYVWYAPPADFKVVIAATPSQPRWLTIVQPDGTKRTFALEGPVVIRRPVVVRR